MRLLNEDDIEALAIGATILGSGGGGDAIEELPIIHYFLKTFELPQMIELEEIEDDSLVLPVAFIGSPLVAKELIPSGQEICQIVNKVRDYTGCSKLYLLAAEIGGSNALTPFYAAVQMQIPVINGDTLGRAFPELQMSACHLHGISASPCFIAGSQGETALIEAKDAQEMEQKVRELVISLGSSAAAGLYLMSGKEAKQVVIAKTMDRAMQLGYALKKGQTTQEMVSAEKGMFLSEGLITDLQLQVKEGFSYGYCVIEGSSKLRIEFQNENLCAKNEDKIMAITPDIIAIFDAHTGLPLTTEALNYGMRVKAISLPSPILWTSPQGLKLVGPNYFGYKETICVTS